MTIFVCDLHTHTHYSDGSLSVPELLEKARSSGLDAIAITDHDTVQAHRYLAESNLSSPVQVIPGVEFSSRWNNIDIHLVGLNIDIKHSAITEAEQFYEQLRIDRAKRVAEKLEKAVGLPSVFEQVMCLVGEDGQITRPHFAQLLINKGKVKSAKEAFNKYLGQGKAAYVATQWPSVESAVSWITAANGVAVLAHPVHYNLTRSKFLRLVDDFVMAGGQALEVITSQQKPELIKYFVQVAKERNLYCSLGSDFHGDKMPWAKLGGIPRLPAEAEPVWQLWS